MLISIPGTADSQILHRKGKVVRHELPDVKYDRLSLVDMVIKSAQPKIPSLDGFVALILKC